MTQREQRARALEAEGALRPALQEWELIQTVSPSAEDVDAEIARLRYTIDIRFAEHRNTARAAAVRSDYRAARVALLKALALKPDDVKAIAELKSLEGRRAYASMVDAPRVSDVIEREIDVYTAPERRSVDDNPVDSEPSGTNAAKLREAPQRSAGQREAMASNVAGDNTRRGIAHLSRSEHAAALELFLQEKRNSDAPNDELDALIAETRHALADHHYAKGVLAFRSADYDRAVSEFELALKYAPDHHKARFYHSSAKQLRGD